MDQTLATHRYLKKKCLLILFLAAAIVARAQDSKLLPYADHRLSFEQRVQDLVGRMTLEEKVAQMLNAAPAIPRLNIPAYDWWNEVLHGIARTPYKVTVYPQAIAMAATFDTFSLKRMAHFSATEGRAVYNRATRENKTGQRYVGLTYWTPNINIFRDPRWGRGQETYGEDPFLTAMLGKAFVAGLQGDHPKYLLAAACAKHYAVHSGPEPSRHVFNATATDHDLWNTYLPAFKELVQANVAGVMCAYNAFQKQPCCASDLLMNDILRNKWGFTGYVTSDCKAIDDFYKNHKTHPDAATAAADAVLHGTDIDCGNEAYKALVQAVQKGYISEAQIDVSVRRLFMIRFRLGMFDPPSIVPFSQTNDGVLEHPDHAAHALKMAQQSIVLLQNKGSVLPLRKNLRKIAVLGPNADNAIAVLGNYNGTPSHIVTPLEGIRKKLGAATEIVYEKAVQYTNDTLMQYTDLRNQFSFNGQQGFLSEYYNNGDLKGVPVTRRMEPVPEHAWQEGELVTDTMKAAYFSARYTADFKAVENGVTHFEIEADDGYRVNVAGKEVLNAWSRNRWAARSFSIKTVKDSTYRILVDYVQREGKGNIHLRTGVYVKTDMKQLVERIQDADAILFVGGISPELEGEEMKVNFPGFNGGDRTTISLPAVQTAVLKALQATGKPVVFVMMTGSAIAIPWEADHIPAVVNCWYGGQSAGTALADVLFGDYNPAGRLPVTFYRGDTDLPGFNDYSMQNRTYRYFKGNPLFGFGHGLSYTQFRYDGFTLPVALKTGASLPVQVKVTNSGKRDGEEVVQLYVHPVHGGPRAAIRSLKGFQRIHLKAGETRTVSFVLQPADLGEATGKGVLETYVGAVRISVGGGQPFPEKLAAKSVVQKTILLRK